MREVPSLISIKEEYRRRPMRLAVELLKEFHFAFEQNDKDRFLYILNSISNIGLNGDALVGLLANIKKLCKELGGRVIMIYRSTVEYALTLIEVEGWTFEDIEGAKKLLRLE